ncbi:hypothetical protein [Methylobacterium komagatae]|uniref:hypothetical protein n=1 Tax=Methylobacterium komagatae TaxID=374425 RepID=UPI003672BA9A
MRRCSGVSGASDISFEVRVPRIGEGTVHGLYRQKDAGQILGHRDGRELDPTDARGEDIALTNE